MAAYLLKRLLYVVPIGLGVSFVCFLLVHIAPGDPLSAVCPPDSPTEVIEALRQAYGLDKPLPAQFLLWLGKALRGDLGHSIATGRPVAGEVLGALCNTVILAFAAALIGFTGGAFLGCVAGYRVGSPMDTFASALSVMGVSVPHYWLGIVLTIIFSVTLNLLPAMGAGPGDSRNWTPDLEHLKYLVLPALTMSVIPLGIITRTIRALVADVLAQEFVQALEAKGLSDREVFRHVIKNVAPTSLAVMGLQFGYLLGGSILIETVFAWPGTGFLLNSAIFQRDIPLLQGIILVLSMFFVLLNLLVDLMQQQMDPRMRRK